MKPASIDYKGLQEAALSLRGTTDDNQVRLCLGGKKSFLEGTRQGIRTEARFSASGRSLDVYLPFTSFQKLCKLFREDPEAWMEGDKLVLREGGREVSLVVEETTDKSPAPRWSEPHDFLEADAKLFRSRLQGALRAASQDPGRPVLQTVAIDEVEGEVFLVATDSFRLLALPLHCSLRSSLPRPLLIPRDVAKLLAGDIQRLKPEEVVIEWGEEEGHWGATVAYGSVAWHFVSPEGQYPAWQELLRSRGARMEISRDEIQSLLAFVEALQGRGRPEQNGAAALRLHLGDEVRASFAKPGLGEIEQKLQRSVWHGEPQVLGVNPLFLQDMLDVTEGEKIEVSLGETSGGLVFSGKGPEKYLLMPVRLPE